MADIIVETIASKPLSMSFLSQADRLLKLLESSVFVHLRVHLVDVMNPTRYVMVRSLLRFMMLLPQVRVYIESHRSHQPIAPFPTA